MPSPFLTAEWRWLAMLNYEVDPAVLKPFMPAGTELDARGGRTWVSVVGFHFRHARVRGIVIPFHEHFEEVNLRFYVKRTVGGEVRRGVVFIKELVPRWAIAWTARCFYNENYVALPMKHRVHKYGLEKRATYEWTFRGQQNQLEARAMCEGVVPADDSFEAFITEHYWGYAKQKNGSTLEYRVEHPRWRVWAAIEAELHCDVAGLYGKAFAPFLTAEPASAFIADGSAVKVYPGVRI